MTYAPVIIPTLNRYQHFKECVESLATCTHADKTELVIGLDYPPAEKYVEGWKQIKEYIPTITGFGKVKVFEHDHNLGAVGNSDFLIDYVFKHYDVYIFTEDDNVFSPCFLDYINKSLEKYKNDNEIIFIMGYFLNEKINLNFHGNTVALIQGNTTAWGYATWIKKYNNYVKNIVPNYRKKIFSHNKKTLKDKVHLNNYLSLLRFLDKKSIDRPCDVTYSINNIQNGYYNIVSNVIMVKNMGYDGSGVNCGDDTKINEQNIMRNITTDTTFSLIDNNIKQYTTENETILTNYWNGQKTARERRNIKFFISLTYLFGFTPINFIRRLLFGIKHKIQRILSSTQ